ncbi:hypothetical protein [Frigidibacter sp. MR17.24]|uniref:hypothetical protein n=1 Tax=Frigidibacter sp. MR17.24 TaxID=3127345 RepID=UPI003012AEA6
MTSFDTLEQRREAGRLKQEKLDRDYITAVIGQQELAERALGAATLDGFHDFPGEMRHELLVRAVPKISKKAEAALIQLKCVTRAEFDTARTEAQRRAAAAAAALEATTLAQQANKRPVRAPSETDSAQSA